MGWWHWCYCRTVNLNSVFKCRFFYRHALLCIDFLFVPMCLSFQPLLCYLEGWWLAFYEKWFMLSLSCNYWDARAGTVEQTAVSLKDQILAKSVTTCGSIIWAAVVLAKSLGGELGLVMSLNILVSFVETLFKV